jgi:hypothetical protein
MNILGGTEAGRDTNYVTDSEGGTRVMDKKMVGAIEMLLEQIVSLGRLGC